MPKTKVDKFSSKDEESSWVLFAFGEPDNFCCVVAESYIQTDDFGHLKCAWPNLKSHDDCLKAINRHPVPDPTWEFHEGIVVKRKLTRMQALRKRAKINPKLRNGEVSIQDFKSMLEAVESTDAEGFGKGKRRKILNKPFSPAKVKKHTKKPLEVPSPPQSEDEHISSGAGKDDSELDEEDNPAGQGENMVNKTIPPSERVDFSLPSTSSTKGAVNKVRRPNIDASKSKVVSHGPSTSNAKVSSVMDDMADLSETASEIVDFSLPSTSSTKGAVSKVRRPNIDASKSKVVSHGPSTSRAKVFSVMDDLADLSETDFRKAVLLKLASIEQNQQIIKELIEIVSASIKGGGSTEICDGLSTENGSTHFPLRNLEGLADFNQSLGRKSFDQKMKELMVTRLVKCGSKGASEKDRLDYAINNLLLPFVLHDRLTACLNIKGNRGKTGIENTRFFTWIIEVVLDKRVVKTLSLRKEGASYITEIAVQLVITNYLKHTGSAYVKRVKSLLVDANNDENLIKDIKLTEVKDKYNLSDVLDIIKGNPSFTPTKSFQLQLEEQQARRSKAKQIDELGSSRHILEVESAGGDVESSPARNLAPHAGMVLDQEQSPRTVSKRRKTKAKKLVIDSESENELSPAGAEKNKTSLMDGKSPAQPKAFRKETRDKDVRLASPARKAEELQTESRRSLLSKILDSESSDNEELSGAEEDPDERSQDHRSESDENGFPSDDEELVKDV